MPKNKCMSFGAFRSVLPVLYGQKLSATPGSRAKLEDVSVFNGICGSFDRYRYSTCTKKLPVGLWVDPLKNNVLAAR